MQASLHVIAPRNEIEEQLMVLWLKLLQLDTLSVEDNFFDKGGHSLLAVQLIASLRQAFQLELGVNLLFEAPTIAKLSAIIEKKIEQLPITIKLISNLKPDNVVTLEPSGAQKPLFLFHPIGGSVLSYRHLSQQLQLDRPIYAFQDPGLETEQILFSRIEEMAHHYLAQIKIIQPHGPYYLCGYSMGGIVAVEIAAQLQAKNEAIGWLGLLDSWAFSIDQPELIETAYLRAAEQYSHFKKKLHCLPCDTIFFEKLYQHHAMLLAQYCLSPIRCPIHLFKANEAGINGHDDPTNYWERYADSTLTVYPIPGNHNTILVEPQVAVLAAQIVQIFTRMEPMESSTHYQHADKYQSNAKEFFD